MIRRKGIEKYCCMPPANSASRQFCTSWSKYSYQRAARMAHRGMYFREAKCTTLLVYGIHSETSVSLLLGVALEI